MQASTQTLLHADLHLVLNMRVYVWCSRLVFDKKVRVQGRAVAGYNDDAVVGIDRHRLSRTTRSVCLKLAGGLDCVWVRHTLERQVGQSLNVCTKTTYSVHVRSLDCKYGLYRPGLYVRGFCFAVLIS